MLYGCQNIYSDHKNNTFTKLQTQHVLCWQLFLENYAVQFCYIKGESNSLADALSRLPFDERSPSNQHNHLRNHYDSTVQKEQLESFYLLADDEDVIDLFVHLPLLENAPFVLDYQSIVPAKFQQQLLAPNTSTWCYTVDPNQGWKIYLPDALLEHAIWWS
jgi:hypothetical protein